MREWLKKMLCVLASKITNKYGYHQLDVDSKVLLRGEVYIITGYKCSSSINELSSMTIDGVSPTIKLNNIRRDV